ncbi:MAG TPA: glycosyltransferase family 4 protein [Oculatellaceae cyanobacterium]|jgi:glycosyltransferase involved in cell wall biosynthesis
MRILFANNFFGPFGGAENVMWDEANLLQRQGHDVHFFATDRKPYFIPNYENAHFFPAYADFRNVSTWDKLKRMSRIFYNREAEERLTGYLRYLKPDLVHVHNLHYHLSPSILAACQREAVPVVMTLHDIRMICPSASLTESADFRGLCNTGNPLICMKKKCKNGSLSETLVSVAEYYANRRHSLYQSVRMFITPSAALLELVSRFGIPRAQLMHINNFIDPQLVKQAATCAEDSREQGYFLYVGRLSREKGVQYLLQAMRRLPDVHLKIAGSGPYEAELKALALALNLQNVEFLGFKDKVSVSTLLAECRATVLPCNWFENLPLSVIESLAFAKPVIASRVGGLPEILDQGRCGLLVEPGNVEQLADALADLTRNPQKARTLGLAGQVRAREVYSEERHLEQLLALYGRLVSQSATKRQLQPC